MVRDTIQGHCRITQGNIKVTDLASADDVALLFLEMLVAALDAKHEANP